MKKFFDGGEYFVLTSYRIKTVPIAEDNEVGLTLAKTICEEACYLSSAGTGQTSIEILRIAGRKTGSPIHHLLTIRTHDSLSRIVLFARKRSKKASFHFFISLVLQRKKYPLRNTESIFPRWIQTRSGH